MTGCIWDSGNKSASITLGRSSLVAVTSAGASTWKSLRATTSQSSGKFYLEYILGGLQNNGTIAGFANASLNTANYVGSDANSFGVQNQGSQYNLTGGSWQGWTKMGTILQCAIDITNKLVWFRTDRNQNWNNDVIGNQNPATGTGGKSFTTTGALFPAWAGFADGTLQRQSIGINAGGFTFAGSIPSGFSAWDTTTPTLDTTISGTSAPSLWDSGNKHANVTLSGGSLTATVGTGINWAPVRSTSSRKNGQWYFETTLNSIDVANGWICGAVESSWPTTTLGKYPGIDQFSYGYQTGSSPDWYYTGSAGQMSTGPNNTTTTHVYGFAVDLNRGLIWVKDITAGGNWNADASGDPVTGTRGSFAGVADVFIGWSGFGNPTDGITINFGATAFTGTPPTGYTAWDGGLFTASVSESVTAASTQSGTLTKVASVSESASATATQSTGVVKSGSVSESLSATSTQSDTTNPTVLESASASSTQSAATIFHKSVSESASAAASGNGGVYFLMFVNETLNASDPSDRSIVSTKTIVETLHATDRAVEGIRPEVIETLTPHVTLSQNTNGVFPMRVRESETITDAFHVLFNLSVAESAHPFVTLAESTNGEFNVTARGFANAQDTASSHLVTHSIVRETLTLQDFYGERMGTSGVLNLAVDETATAADSSVDPETFTTLGLLFWGYRWAFDKYPGNKLSVWCAGLDCGDWPVNENGSIFVPWQSDADGFFTPARLFQTSNSPPDGGFGASACNIDLRDNTGATHRVVVDVAIGLCYRSQVQILRPNSAEMSHSPSGPSLAETRRLHQYGAQLVNAQALRVGTDPDKLLPVQFREKDGSKYLASKLFTGVHWDILEDDYSYDGMLMMEAFRPYPATIAALAGFMKTFDRE